MSKSETLIIIDSFALIFRAYYAYPPSLTLPDGTIVNAVYGFTSLLMDVLTKFKPSHVIAVFDPQGPTIRQSEYVLYKANRKETDSALINQIPLVQELLQKFDIPVLKVSGYEADDVIATIDKRHSGPWARTIVVTGDQDLFQLVDEDTFVYLAGRTFSESKLYDANGVMEKLGVAPVQIPDYKALNGDASDNIPGVKGIGKKTAEELLKKFGHLEDIFENIGELSARQQTLLSESYEIAMTSKKLATVEANVPISFDFKDALFDTFDFKKVLHHFEVMRFRSLIKKAEKLAELYTVNESVGLFETLSDQSAQTIKPTLNPLDLSLLEKQKSCSIDAHLLHLEKSPIHWEIETIEVLIEEASYIVKAASFNDFVDVIIKNKILIIGFDVKKFLHVVANHKKEYAEILVYDVGFAGFLIAKGRANFNLDSFSDFFEVPMSLSNLETIRKIYQACGERLAEDEKLSELFTLETNLLKVVIGMEQEGITMDTELLKTYEERLLSAQQELVTAIYKDVGHEFNIGSPKQVGEVLFGEKQLQGAKKTKTGSFSTNESVLKKLVAVDPVVGKLLRYREIDKLLSTYIRTLPQFKDQDSRVHSIFDQFGAVSGRFSSKNPNMQNVPINESIDVNIRNAFVSAKGNTLVSFDYSQQELRILAAIANEKEMIDNFNKDEDIHRITAAELFDKPVVEVTDHERRVGKTVNFSVVYGVSAYGLSDQLQISHEEARLFIAKYYNKYQSVKSYFEDQRTTARKLGYVETLFGRKRSSATINSGNRFIREAAERELLNFRIQGSAADIMKVAMLQISEKLSKYNAKLLLQIHDEFVFEISKDADIDSFIADIQLIMENAHNIGVKYKVNASVAERWGEL